jgi:hypothetical protein
MQINFDYGFRFAPVFVLGHHVLSWFVDRLPSGKEIHLASD